MRVPELDRRIWTIGWEVGVEAGSIDLLLLDSTARIWVVETKLAANPEIKKQVVPTLQVVENFRQRRRNSDG